METVNLITFLPMASITSLAAADTGPTSRGIINSNFTNINNELTTASSDINAAQTDITALETDKLNRNNQLRTGNGAWKVSYTNASGNETELALGAADTFLKSNGSASAPSFGNPTVDINGLTEDTAGDMDADFALVYDTSAGEDRKQKVNVFRATDSEADTGSSTTKFTTPSQIDKYAVSTSLRSDWFTYQLPPIFTGIFSGTVPVYTGVGEGTATPSGGAGYAITYFVVGTGISGVKYKYSTSKDLRFKIPLSFSDTSERKSFGFATSTTASNVTDDEDSITDGTIRFLANGANLWAHNANGSARTKTQITGVTLTSKNIYEIVINPGTDIKFYVNGVLKATHTTNIPTNSTDVNFYFGANNGRYMCFLMPTFSLEN